MRALPIPEGAKRWRNFPYADETAPFAPVPLAIASYRNGLQYFASRRRAFRVRRQPAVLAFLARAERTVFLAGSCGLEFLNNLELPPPVLAKIAVFAYGPVARRRPACAHLLVGSRRDAISRRYFPQPDVSVNATHLDYLTSPDVADACRVFIARVMHGEI
jgi:hypothetical protein